MNFLALSSALSLALLVGCAAQEATDSSESNVTDRPAIQLSSTKASSVEAKLVKLLDTFKSDKDLGIGVGIESAAWNMSGVDQAGTRSLSCSKTGNKFDCTLEGFDKIRNGGQLPQASIDFEGNEAPLAAKLLSLLQKGADKGNLGVERHVPPPPGCCDIPSTSTYTIGDDTSTLTCKLTTGGFTGARIARCEFLANDTPAPASKPLKGTLVRTFGIGGENTGLSAQLENGELVELVLSTDSGFVAGRVARITGSRTTLSGVETSNRPAINVSDLLVCPAPGTTFNLMPPVTNDVKWIGDNCPDLELLH